MARFVAILLLVAVVCSAYAFPKNEVPEECGLNEYFDTCGTVCEPTCQNPEPKSCFFSCRASCQCNSGFMRSHPNGECIKKEKCLLRD